MRTVSIETCSGEVGEIVGPQSFVDVVRPTRPRRSSRSCFSTGQVKSARLTNQRGLESHCRKINAGNAGSACLDGPGLLMWHSEQHQ